MRLRVKRDTSLDVLLELNDTEYTEENGYWYRIEARLVEPAPERPHGIRYNLTLHDNYNRRIFGFDNSHAVKKTKNSKGKYKGRIVEYDHVHQYHHDKGSPYTFKTAEQLLQDFFNSVNRILNNINGR